MLSRSEPRRFEIAPAVRSDVPMMIGLMGPSGGGKTYSALRLATGIQRVVGGEIVVIDTENKRATLYADEFKFSHLPFAAPFSPLDYLAAIQQAVSRGAKTIVVDSMSHEHEGPGGVLELYEEEHQRLGGKEGSKLLAWSKPKQMRQRLINTVQQLGVHLLCCFRAKEKIKPPAKGAEDRKIIELGWMPIAGSEFVYEFMVNFLLPPMAHGVPDFNPSRVGESSFAKAIPEYLKPLFKEGKPLDEATGEAMARWASGDSVHARAKALADLSQVLEAKGYSDPASRLQWVSGQLSRPVNAPKEIRQAELPALIQAAQKIGEA